MGQARELAERALEAIRAEDRAALGALFADDATVKDPMFTARGPEEILARFDPYWSATSGIRHEIRTVLESDDTVALEMRSTGTHERPLSTPQAEVEATGTEIVMESTEWITVREGRIRSWRSYYDVVDSYLEPLRLLPAPKDTYYAGG